MIEKPFGQYAHAAIRKFYRFVVLRRRVKCISPSRVKDSGVEVENRTACLSWLSLPFYSLMGA